MPIHEFLELLPLKIRNLPPIQAMANLISSQASLIQDQSEKIQVLQKAIDELKESSSDKRK